jgi:acetylornithine deacetylase/succinyl-diaminopimelate desuccinylase-like protein
METDEEIFDHDALGIQWLIRNHRDLIDAEFALNEGGSVNLKDGKAVRVNIQTSEKVPVTFQLDVKNTGGHSSVPRKENAIYHLAEGLVRLSKFEFPLHLNDTTRAWFSRTAQFESEPTAAMIREVLADKPDAMALARLSASPQYNAQLHTTCVATMLQGGHAANALPQSATAKVNCRIIPGEAADEVKATLVQVLADNDIAVTQIGREVRANPRSSTRRLSARSRNCRTSSGRAPR